MARGSTEARIGASVEKPAQQTSTAVAAMTASVISVAIPLAITPRRGITRLPAGGGFFVSGAAFDDLFEFVSVQPNTATLRAIIDRDRQALRHEEIDAAVRAQQSLRRSPGWFGISHVCTLAVNGPRRLARIDPAIARNTLPPNCMNTFGVQSGQLSPSSDKMARR